MKLKLVIGKILDWFCVEEPEDLELAIIQKRYEVAYRAYTKEYNLYLKAYAQFLDQKVI